jgi:hypothetical protein
MFDNGKYVDHAGGGLALPDQGAVFAFDVLIVRAAPHMAQAAPDGLLELNARARRA